MEELVIEVERRELGRRQSSVVAEGVHQVLHRLDLVHDRAGRTLQHLAPAVVQDDRAVREDAVNVEHNQRDVRRPIQSRTSFMATRSCTSSRPTGRPSESTIGISSWRHSWISRAATVLIE